MPIKNRSPRYPSIGLGEAVEKVRAVYKKDYQNRLPREVVATHMGYAGLNGKALGVLSTLGKYGLLEGRGDETRVSDLALKIIAHETGTPEWNDAVREAASKPELFVDLDHRFSNGKASDQAIRAYLLTEKFLPDAADVVVRCYRETKQLAASAGSEYNLSPQREPERTIQEPPREEAPETDSESSTPASSPQTGRIRLMEGERELTTGLLSREANFRVIVSGKVGGKEIERLIRNLELVKEILADSETEHPAPSDDNN